MEDDQISNKMHMKSNEKRLKQKYRYNLKSYCFFKNQSYFSFFLQHNF